MTLVKWTPRPINISNDFDDMFRTLFHSEVENPLNKEIDWKPEIDIKESDNLFQIKADIPGLTKKDIKISVKGDQLTISGERKTLLIIRMTIITIEKDPLASLKDLLIFLNQSIETKFMPRLRTGSCP